MKKLSEIIELNEIHDRYMRSHGKKASGRGRWMFTTKRMGDVAHKDMYHHDKEDTVSKAAAAARKHFGTKDVYVMEEIELGEGKDGVDQHPEVRKRFDAIGKTKPDSYERRRAVNAYTNKKKELRRENEEREEAEISEAASPYHKAAAHLEKMTKDPKFSRAYKEDIPDIKSHIDHLKSNDPARHKQSARHSRNHDTIIRDIVSDAVHKNSSKEHSKAWHDHAGLQRLREGTAAYGKSMDAIADKKKKAGMTASDKDKMSKVADLMRKEREKRAAMQEAADPSKYKAGSEASKFGGHRPHLKNPDGKTSYLGGTAYKTASHAAGEAAAYHKGYFHSAGTKASERGAERAVRAYREKNKQHIYTKEEYALDEVAGQRGRPKRGEGQESDRHIIMQLRSAQDLDGKKDIKFSSGKTAQVHPDHINKILKMHDQLQKPEDKRRLRAAIGRSHEHLKRVASAIK